MIVMRILRNGFLVFIVFLSVYFSGCTEIFSIEKEGMLWPSNPPADCPFEKSEDISNILFTGRYATYTDADTWYPSWALDGNLYSPWTDGSIGDVNCGSGPGDKAHTAQAVIVGDDPLDLKVESIGVRHGSALPYGGRYPCGSLVYNGVWYYGTYCLDWKPEGYNWGTLGPFVGFRWSTDRGKTWTETPHTPERPIFGESGKDGHSVKIGSPHFVDFGKNMEHSPDGKAYLIAHGSALPDPKPRPANNSWISGDQIYLFRIDPGIEVMNDPSHYEFYAGRDEKGAPLWTKDFDKIEPLIDWNNRCGCVTMTYNAPLKKYLMCVTDGWPTTKAMNTYLLESDTITGPWKLITFMNEFGPQAYFVNIPTKFISADGRTAWLCYSANFTRKNYDGTPPGSRYKMCLHEIKLLH